MIRPVDILQCPTNAIFKSKHLSLLESFEDKNNEMRNTQQSQHNDITSIKQIRNGKTHCKVDTQALAAPGVSAHRK